ncbi:MAG TPA: lysylphosphatidylglycerol synthase transmembrane domain-containing protein [Candidatus Fimivivens sp.]|nr:lysylphosphatidylglycerol synthase transmembrane domain-containing protein [Candidatus Fimivivens sp.]
MAVIAKELRKKVIFVLKAAMAVALIVLLVIKVDWTKIWSEVSEASPLLLLVATLLYVAGLFMCIERWWRAAHYKKFAMTFWDAAEFFFAGLFLNNFLPSFFGGDAYQSYILGKSEHRYPAAISTVMFTRFIGLWATISLFFTFGLLGWSRVFTKPVFEWFGIGLLFFLVADLVLVFVYAHPRFKRFVEWLPEKIRCFFSEIGGYAKWPFLRENFILSTAFAFVGVGMFNLMLFFALGERVPIFPYLATVFLISLVSSLPVSINNIGLKEWAYFTFFPLIGIRPEAALAVALLGRFIQILISLVGAPFFFREKKEYGTDRA